MTIAALALTMAGCKTQGPDPIQQELTDLQGVVSIMNERIYENERKLANIDSEVEGLVEGLVERIVDDRLNAQLESIDANAQKLIDEKISIRLENIDNDLQTAMNIEGLWDRVNALDKAVESLEHELFYPAEDNHKFLIDDVERCRNQIEFLTERLDELYDFVTQGPPTEKEKEAEEKVEEVIPETDQQP